MTRYPLLFGFRDLIAGKGFVASVSLKGRALLVDEEARGFWMYGVNPGGVAAQGATAGRVQDAFRAAYRSVLTGIAAQARGYSELEREMNGFVEATNHPTAAEWQEAVFAIREGKVCTDHLPKRTAESRIGVQILLLEHPVPFTHLRDEAELAA